MGIPQQQIAVPRISRSRAWLFRIATLLVGISLAEVTLSAMALISPRVNYYLTPAWSRALVRDPLLGIRMSPFYPENDRWGFRNPAVPKECQILTVGASTTYGFSAPAQKSWPRQLEKLTGQSVYNMSCGGYGPCEFKVLLDKGLTLNPKTVLCEIYPGNDIAESYGSVYLEKRFPQYRSQDQKALGEMEKADQLATLPEMAMREGGMSGVGGRQRADEEDDDDGTGPIRAWISKHSALYAVGRELLPIITGKRYRSMFRDDQAAEDNFENSAARPHRLKFDGDPHLRTVFLNPKYTMLACQLDDPRIREGQRIMQSIILAMQEETHAKNARFVIVIIPSKEVVYRDLVRRCASRTGPELLEAIAMEERATAELVSFMQTHHVEFIQPLAALRAALERGHQIYHESDDSHLGSDGYTVFAEALTSLFAKPDA
jgi:hypothetical protein